MNDDDRAAEVIAAWQEDRDLGRIRDPEAVIAEHPELAGRLRARFAALNVVEQLFAERQVLTGETPRRIGDFEIVRVIGRGGMGVVYEAVQTSMDRRVALKVLYPSVVGSKRAVERFLREAKITGRLQHTNVVPVYALGVEGTLHYYAMELVEGSSLAQVLGALRALGQDPGPEHETLLGASTPERVASPPEERPTPEDHERAASMGTSTDAGYWRRVAAMVAEVADALHAAHDRGLIHRDVKPANLMLDLEGRLKLLDFGLARMADGSGGMTVTGEVLGTPAYMSPEQVRGRSEDVGPQADVYSLGATLYELLTLHPPFDAADVPQLYRRILSEDPPRPRTHNRKIPRDLETVVLKAMEKAPEARYATARAFARDLRAFADGHPIRARRIGLLESTWRKAKRHKALTTLGALLLVALLAASILAMRAGREQDRRRTAEYDLLLDRAAVALPTDLARGTRDGESAALLERAARLDPSRREAHLGIALSPVLPADTRLAAVAASSERGLHADTAARLRAVVLHEAGRAEEASRAWEHVPTAPSPASPLDTLLVGLHTAQQGETQEAVEALSRAIEAASPGAPGHRSSHVSAGTARRSTTFTPPGPAGTRPRTRRHSSPRCGVAWARRTRPKR